MSHAEALQTLHPAVGATEAIVEFVNELRHAALTDEVRHYARRHLLDTVGVMIAGAGGEVATRAEAVLAAVRPAGRIPVPGRARRADLIDAAFLGGTAAHGIELDDGFRQGSVHPGCVVVPAVLALGYDRADHRRGADRGAWSPATRPRSRSGAPAIPTCASADSIRRPRSACSVRSWRPASCAGSRPGNSPTRSASPPRARPGCSRSSTAAPTSSACTPATPRAKACRPRCWRSKGSKARPT